MQGSKFLLDQTSLGAMAHRSNPMFVMVFLEIVRDLINLLIGVLLIMPCYTFQFAQLPPEKRQSLQSQMVSMHADVSSQFMIDVLKEELEGLSQQETSWMRRSTQMSKLS